MCMTVDKGLQRKEKETTKSKTLVLPHQRWNHWIVMEFVFAIIGHQLLFFTSFSPNWMWDLSSRTYEPLTRRVSLKQPQVSGPHYTQLLFDYFHKKKKQHSLITCNRKHSFKNQINVDFTFTFIVKKKSISTQYVWLWRAIFQVYWLMFDEKCYRFICLCKQSVHNRSVIFVLPH